MISVDDLWRLLDQAIAPLPPRPVPLPEAAGLVLAEALKADADQPAFDRSAMDGFAIREGAAAGVFRVPGAILPGQPAPGAPGEREAWRVYTGSALPPGVRVIKQEDAALSADTVRIDDPTGPDHVRRRGGAVRRGETLLPAGCRLTPARIAIAAGAGWVRPVAVPRPNVFHLTTGSEIVPPSATPGPGRIRDTNGPLMEALVKEAGGDWMARAHAGESVEEGVRLIREAGGENADLLLVSGGASVGDYDGSATLLERLGFTLICRKVRSRPGKPLLVGVRGAQIAFGLPGNPVSHFVAFHLFVRRAIALLMGQGGAAPLQAVLEPGAALNADPRETFWPARARLTPGGWGVAPLPWLDSGHLAALGEVNALLRLPSNALPQTGDRVEIISCGAPASLS